MPTELHLLITQILQESISAAVLTAVLVFLAVGLVKLILKGIWRALTDIPSRLERRLVRRSGML